jgi:Na+-driven multidrug efflux pump
VTKVQASLSWIASLILLAITAGQSWQSFQVSASAGGGTIDVSGLLAFPIIGTLVSLQVVIVLISLLVKPLVTRILAAAVLPLTVWNFTDVLANSNAQIQSTVVGVLAEQTGVLEEVATSGFLVSSSGGVFIGLFLFTLGLNSLLLAFFALVAIKNPATKSIEKDSQLPEDIWSSQNRSSSDKVEGKEER